MSDANNTATAAVISLATVVANGTTAEVIERIASKANANRVIKLAEGRIEKAEAAIKADKAFIAGVQNVVNELPEGTTTVTIVANVNDVINVRRRSKEGATVVEATVVAKKEAEGDKLAQLRVQIGSGFDAELINVFPGQVVSNVTTGEGVAPTAGGTDAAPDSAPVEGGSSQDDIDALLG